MPEITLLELSSAIAVAVKAALPDVTICPDSAGQQTELPSIQIAYRDGGEIQKQIGNRFLRKINYDLIYQEGTVSDLTARFLSVVDTLDEALELIAFPEANPIRTLNRKWLIESSMLHYQFDIMLRVSQAEQSASQMETLDFTEEVKNG